MRKNDRYMSRNDRIAMETLLNAGHRISEVAKQLGFSRQTIYREYKRGRYEHLNTDYTTDYRYSSDLGQKAAEYAQSGKGRPLKIGNDMEFAEYIEDRIVRDKYSPAAALASASSSGSFSTSVCLATLYSYIDKGIFYNLTNKNLPVKSGKKKRHKRVRTVKRASAGTFIEKRPHEVSGRETAGHWEMDTVKGKRGKTKSCLLVLTERMSRYELIFKLPHQGASAVVAALDTLEDKLKGNFGNIFKTITCDNGVEFSDFETMQRSASAPCNRTEIYYCHPYSSWERGSNENNNKLIRRHAPKGTDLDKLTESDVKHIQKWMNTYPRKLFGWKSSEDILKENLKNVILLIDI